MIDNQFCFSVFIAFIHILKGKQKRFGIFFDTGAALIGLLKG